MRKNRRNQEADAWYNKLRYEWPHYLYSVVDEYGPMSFAYQHHRAPGYLCSLTVPA